jgi:hypothetical protein
LKPYIVLALDTSGSMDEATGSGPPVCGGADTKLNHARCAITRIVNSYGDIVFAFGRFRTVMGGTTTAATFPTGCCLAGPDDAANGSCAAGAACRNSSNGVSNDWFEMLSALVDGGNQSAAKWTNLTGNTCNAVGSDPEVWDASGNTPLEGTLKGVKQYWLGQQETDYTVWPAASAGFSPISNDPTANAFLGPAGCNSSATCTTNCCTSQCRPYIVILLTDGAETCGGTPQNAAASLLTTSFNNKRYKIQTKPIGFGISPGDAQIEAIAHSGGATDLPGQNEGYYATDEAGVELAISSILAGAVRFETCNGLDDDCDGSVDEGFNLGAACDNGKQGVCRTTGDTVCSADGTGVTCNAPAGPNGTAEICNGLDDDCDGKIDEGLTGCVCNPTAELCNNMDDDCDGNIDEGITRSCGTGTCLGTETCVAGAFVGCTAQSPTTEICNGLDDDCDGVVDGFTQGCSNLVTPGGPATDNPGTTAACMAEGPACVCHPGQETCPAGGDGHFGACLGEVGPSPEICDGLDNDCDGIIDEDTGGADCSSNCGIGQTVCQNGTIVCNSVVATSDDTCNGVDDDCDGLIDEDWVCPDLDHDGNCDPCTDGGLICNGVNQCVGGQVICTGNPVVQESCNCLDDDCDGQVDEGNLCPSGSTCTNCQCAFPCGSGEFPCPLGKACVAGYCVADPCYNVTCPAVNGNVQQCVANGNAPMCVDTCSIVSASCGADEVCVGSTGTCQPNNCTTFPDMCAANQVCVNGTCITNLCLNVTCPTGQYCEAGNCVQSCADVICPDGQRCRLGACETDPCGHPCPYGQACNDASGQCESDPCAAVICPAGQWCDPNHEGACEDDPCVGTSCPDSSQVCKGGTCYNPDQFLPDAAGEAHVTTGGGGGCDSGGGGAGLALLLGLAPLARRRRSGGAS